MLNIAASSRRQPWVIIVALMAAELVAAFESGMVYAAMGTFVRIFGDPVSVGWLVTAYLLIAAASAAIGGRLGDLYGRKRLLLITLVFAGAGSLISGATDQLLWVLIGRAMQGAVGAVLPLCYGLVKETLPDRRVAFGIGVVSATAALGAGLGIVLGGVIVDRFSWAWLFHCSAIGAVLSFFVVWAIVPRSPVRHEKVALDVVGGLLFVPAIFGVLMAVTKAKSWGWFDQRTAGLLFGSLLLLAFWVRYELRHPRPLIDVRLFGNRQIALANLLMALAALGAMQAQIPALLLQQPSWTLVGLGASATLAGLISLPSNFSGAIGAPWSGHVAMRHGAKRAAIYCMAILFVGWLVLAFFHGSVWVVGGVMLLTGFGVAGVFAAVPNLLVEVVPAERISEATGLSAVVRHTFGGIGSQLVALTLASSVVSDPAHGPGRYPTEAAFTLTMGLVAGACAVGLLVACALGPRKAVAGPARDVSQSGERQEKFA